MTAADHVTERLSTSDAMSPKTASASVPYNHSTPSSCCNRPGRVRLLGP